MKVLFEPNFASHWDLQSKIGPCRNAGFVDPEDTRSAVYIKGSRFCKDFSGGTCKLVKFCAGELFMGPVI